MLWRVFFSAAISTFTLGFLQALKTGGIISLSDAALLKFGNIDIIYSPLSDAIVAIIIGIVCGLLGAIFVSVNSHLGVYRKKYINTNFKKIIEVVFFSLVTGSLFFWLAAADKKCPPKSEYFEEYYPFTCPTGTFNC